MGIVAMVLFKMAVGYAVCVLASRQSGLLKTLGYTIGVAILILALGGGLCKTYMKCDGFGKKMSHKGHRGMMCDDKMLKQCSMMK